MRVGATWFVAALLSLWVLRANVSPDFTPIRSELANAQGFSRGVLNAVVLFGDDPFTRVPEWSVLLCATVFLLLAAVTPTVRLKLDTSQGQRSRVSVWVPLLLAGLAVAVLAVVAISPHLSPYRVVLAPRTFALLVGLVCARRAFVAGSGLAARWRPEEAVRRRLLIASTGALAAVFFASAMLQTLAIYDGNYSGFLHISKDVALRAPFLQERPDLLQSLIVYDAGYDGQFMYLMAFDPFLQRFADSPQAYRALIDDPPYRYGRIGFSLLTNVVSAGHPEHFPIAMMWLIVAAHFALAGMLASLAASHGMTPLAGLWTLAIPGFTSSLMSALPEALAAAALVAGLLGWEKRRPVLAAVAFGAALLLRETGVVLIVALVLSTRRQDSDWTRAALVFVLSLLPVCLWRLFVASRLFPDFGWAAMVPNPGDFGLPFAGLLHLWQAGIGRTQPALEIAGAIVFPLILTTALILSVALLCTRPGPIEAAAALYAGIAVSLNYEKIWSHVPSGERGTFELFLCVLILLLGSRTRPAWARQTLTGFFVVLAAYTFLVAPDAATSRAALLLIR